MPVCPNSISLANDLFCCFTVVLVKVFCRFFSRDNLSTKNESFDGDVYLIHGAIYTFRGLKALINYYEVERRHERKN